ncbi:MAG: twin-arginine translocase TatA/TatE family subunit [Anaerovoracaceae bacterium]
MRLGWAELVIILVIVLVIFGGSKLKGLGGALGKNIKDFKDEIKSEDPADDKNNAGSMTGNADDSEA